MSSIITGERVPPDELGGRKRRRLTNEVKNSLRELTIQLSLLNHQVVAHLDFNDGDLPCLDLLARHGPMSPSALARKAGLHPATITGVLDRLERGHWVVRERDPVDRRAVCVRVLGDRGAEIFRLYAGMSSAMDDVCGQYTDDELRLILGFIRATAHAGQGSASELAGSRD
ncbi:MAG TPA: MarR family transcriptional regulator [Streptosporangiaceae bacterium]|jgi:DNA-binding MarR family transcriptional regulator|nr:MarR family transcriptional regulator [Streptosporangiaceae bacterium]